MDLWGKKITTKALRTPKNTKEYFSRRGPATKTFLVILRVLGVLVVEFLPLLPSSGCEFLVHSQQGCLAPAASLGNGLVYGVPGHWLSNQRQVGPGDVTGPPDGGAEKLAGHLEIADEMAAAFQAGCRHQVQGPFGLFYDPEGNRHGFPNGGDQSRPGFTCGPHLGHFEICPAIGLPEKKKLLLQPQGLVQAFLPAIYWLSLLGRALKFQTDNLL
jgi:hypothetical protein